MCIKYKHTSIELIVSASLSASFSTKWFWRNGRTFLFPTIGWNYIADAQTLVLWTISSKSRQFQKYGPLQVKFSLMGTCNKISASNEEKKPPHNILLFWRVKLTFKYVSKVKFCIISGTCIKSQNCLLQRKGEFFCLQRRKILQIHN